MNPEEKAKSLIEKFSPLVTTWDYYNDSPSEPDEILKDAKKYAAICVQEILSFYYKDYQDSKDKTYWHPYDYWQQVLEAINQI